jgi:hypothetical protein
MGKSIEATFKGKEESVLAEIDRDGIDAVMERYGWRNHKRFAYWVERHRDPALSKLAGMVGGEKTMFCHKYRETIIGCLEIFGEPFVMEKFHIQHRDTLDSIIRGDSEPFARKLTRTERVESKANGALNAVKEIQQRLDKIENRLSIHDTDIAQNRGKINELVSFVSKFSEKISDTVARVLIQPLIQRVIQSGCEGIDLKLKDPLELDFPTELEVQSIPETSEPKTALMQTVKTDFEPGDRKLKEIYMLAHPISKED